MTLANDVSTVTLWPWTLIQTQMAFAETMMRAPVVIGARLSLLGDMTPTSSKASMQEFTGMFTEKVQAFEQSQHSIHSSARTVEQIGNAHIRDINRMSGGGMIWPTDITTIFARNMRMFATLIMLPGAALAPFHTRVTANARRLGG